MGKKGRKFIDKNRDVVHTFRVVPRSQRDPLIADENASQYVLQPSEQEENKAEQERYGIFFDDDYNYLQHLRGVKEAINWDDTDLEVYTIRCQDPQAGKKELRGKKLVLPSSLFESYVEEPIGLLNKAAPVSGPRPELDPDVVAMLDDDDGLLEEEGAACNPNDEDALPDDFVLMLNGGKPIRDLSHKNGEEDSDWEDCEEEEDEDREMPALGEPHWKIPPEFSAYRDPRSEKGKEEDEDGNKQGDEEGEERDFSSDFNDSEAEDDLASLDDHRPPLTNRTESHFTNYSLSSSVLQRNKGLSTLDDCFEETYLREYQEEQVGALDGEDIDGWVGEGSLLFTQAVERQRRQIAAAAAVAGDGSHGDRDRIISWIKDMQYCQSHPLEEEDEEEESDESEEEQGEKWDCESILTTASTLYNHPRTITDPPQRKKIAVHPRTGIPLQDNVAGLTRRNLAHHDNTTPTKQNDDGMVDTRTLITSMSAISVRPPGETAEERRCRKKALKELRRERRIEKKLNRASFKEEKKRQEKILQNNKYNYKISLT